MKKILYILLALTLVTVSCKSKKMAKEATQETVVKEEVKTKDNEVSVLTEQNKLEPEDRVSEVAVLSISRSVCFGECPAYTATFFKDGTLLYEGRKNVKNIGKFKGKISVEVLNDFILEIRSIGYFELNESYDNKNVTDLPTTVTYLNHKGKEKKILCRFDCDERLKKINKAIDFLISSVNLQSME